MWKFKGSSFKDCFEKRSWNASSIWLQTYYKVSQSVIGKRLSTLMKESGQKPRNQCSHSAVDSFHQWCRDTQCGGTAGSADGAGQLSVCVRLFGGKGKKENPDTLTLYHTQKLTRNGPHTWMQELKLQNQERKAQKIPTTWGQASTLRLSQTGLQKHDPLKEKNW